MSRRRKPRSTIKPAGYEPAWPPRRLRWATPLTTTLGLAAAGLVVLASLLAAPPASGQAETETEMDIEWVWDFTALGESWPAVKLIVKNAEPCRLPAGVDGPDDPGNGIRVSMDGAQMYETGAPNVLSEFEGVEVRSLVNYYEPSSFTFFASLDSAPRTQSIQAIRIDCRNDEGDWVTVIDQDVIVPAFDNVFRVVVGQDSRDPDRVILFYFVTFLVDEPLYPTPSEVTVAIDGTPVPLDYDAEFLIWVGEIPGDSRDPGLHTAEISLRGETVQRALVVGYNPNPVELAAPTTTTTTEPPTTTTVTPSTAASPSTTDTTGSPTTETPATTEGGADNPDPPVPGAPDDELAAPILPEIENLEFSLADAAQVALATIAVVLLIGFQSDLVNKTIEENTGRFFVPLIGTSINRSFSRAVANLSRFKPWQAVKRLLAPRRQQLAFVAVVVGLALAEHAADDANSILPSQINYPLLFGSAVAIAITALVFACTEEAVNRRVGNQPGEFKLLTWTLIPALVLLLLSRMADFDPPYVYGLVAGFMVSKDAPESPVAESSRTNAIPVLAAAAALITTSLIGFIGYAIYRPEELTFLSQTLAGLFVVGVQGLLFGLVPLRFMEGAHIWNWSKKTWAALYAIVVAAFIYLMVINNPQPTEVEEGADSTSAIIEAAVLFAVFAVLSLGFWAWFRLRPTTDKPAAELQCIGRTRSADGRLTALRYQAGSERIDVPLDELLAHADEGKLPGHLRRQFKLVDADQVPPSDKETAPISLEVVAIRRAKEIVTDLKFSTGLDLTVAETARLQQANIVDVQGLQLINPKNGTPYYRSPANSSDDDNLENYPTFE